MGQVLHGCTRATGAIRRAIQDSKESIAKLSKYYNFSLKTIVFPKVNDKGIIRHLSYNGMYCGFKGKGSIDDRKREEKG